MDWKHDSIKQFINYKLQNPIQSKKAAKNYILQKKKSAHIDKLYKQLLKQRTSLAFFKNQHNRLSQLVSRQVSLNQQNCQQMAQKCNQIKQKIKMRKQLQVQTKKKIEQKQSELIQEINYISKITYEQKLKSDTECKQLQNFIIKANDSIRSQKKQIQQKTSLINKLNSLSKTYNSKKQLNSRLLIDSQQIRAEQQILQQTLTSELQKFKTLKTKAEAFSKHLQASTITKIKLFYQEIVQFMNQKDIFSQLSQNDFRQVQEDGTQSLFLPDSYPNVSKIGKNIQRMRRLLKQKTDMLQTLLNVDQIQKDLYQSWVKSNQGFVVLAKPYELSMFNISNQSKRQFQSNNTEQQNQNQNQNQKQKQGSIFNSSSQKQQKQSQVLKTNAFLLKKLIQLKGKQCQALQQLQIQKMKQEQQADRTIEQMGNKLDRMEIQITKRSRNTKI